MGTEKGLEIIQNYGPPFLLAPTVLTFTHLLRLANFNHEPLMISRKRSVTLFPKLQLYLFFFMKKLVTCSGSVYALST